MREFRRKLESFKKYAHSGNYDGLKPFLSDFDFIMVCFKEGFSEIFLSSLCESREFNYSKMDKEEIFLIEDSIRFLRSRQELFDKNPELLYQEALNLLDTSFMSKVAHKDIKRGLWKDPWLKLVNKKQTNRSAMFNLRLNAVPEDVVISPNGLLCAVAIENIIIVYGTKGWKQVTVLSGHSDTVNACAFSPDSKLIVSGSNDCLLKVWNILTHKCIQTMSGHTSWIMDCIFTHDNQKVISTSEDGSIKVWLIKMGVMINSFEGHTSSVNSCDLSPDGKIIISASTDGTIRFWDFKSGACKEKIEDENSSYLKVEYSLDGSRFLSLAWNKPIIVRDSASLKVIATLGEKNDLRITDCCFSTKKNHIVSVGEDRIINIWDIKKGNKKSVLSNHSAEITSCAVMSNGKCLVTISEDMSLSICEFNAITSLMGAVKGHTGRIMSHSFSEQGDFIVTGSTDESLCLWDGHSGECLKKFEVKHGWVTSCRFNKNGDKVIYTSADEELRILDLEKQKNLLEINTHNTWDDSICLSSDGNRVAVPVNQTSLAIWDIVKGEKLNEFIGHEGKINKIAFSGDNKLIASCSNDQDARVWNLETGLCICLFVGHIDAVNYVAFSKDNNFLITSSDDKTIRIWDIARNKKVKTLRGHKSSVVMTTFIRNDKFCISASDDGSLKMWDIALGKCLKTFSGHKSWVNFFDINNDETQIVSASDDRMLKLWNIDTGNCIGMMSTLGNELMKATFAPNGRKICVTTKNGEMLLIEPICFNA